MKLPTLLLILAAHLLSPGLGCHSGLQYVAPARLDCLPCERDAVSWPVGLKLFWFIIRVLTRLEYDCCKVEVERSETAPVVLRSRYLQSDPDCGMRGRTRRWRLKHAENKTEEERENKTYNGEKEERIVKDGRNPLRIIGGQLTVKEEIPWQVAILKEDGSWDGCGGVLLLCDPVIIVTAAHCVHRSESQCQIFPHSFLGDSLSK